MKLDFLTEDLANFDILAFSETWLRPEVLTVYRCRPSLNHISHTSRVSHREILQLIN